MEKNTSNQKNKNKKNISAATAIVLGLILIISSFLIFKSIWSFFGIEKVENFSKYDKKIYSITSEDGKIQGFVASDMVSCGEFPSDLCLYAYYNILIKEPLPVDDGVIRFGNAIGDRGYLYPIYCDVDIAKINLFNRYDADSLPFKCEIKSKKDSIKYFYISHLDIFRKIDLLEQFPNVNVINVYDSANSKGKLVKTYKVSIKPIN